MTRVENAAPASNAPVPLSTSRRDILGCFIGSFHPLVLARLGTPDVTFYFYSAHLVFRRKNWGRKKSHPQREGKPWGRHFNLPNSGLVLWWTGFGQGYLQWH